jgi:fatty acid desaturase
MNPEPSPLEAKTASLADMAVALLVVPLVAYAPAALSYVGPGAGLGMIASLLAVILAVLATVVGLVLWPIRWYARRRNSRASEAKPPGSDEAQ